MDVAARTLRIGDVFDVVCRLVYRGEAAVIEVSEHVVERPVLEHDHDNVLDRGWLQRSIRLTVPSPELLTQTEPAPASMLAGFWPTRIAFPAIVPLLASILVTVPEPVFTTHTNRPRTRYRVGCQPR